MESIKDALLAAMSTKAVAPGEVAAMRALPPIRASRPMPANVADKNVRASHAPKAKKGKVKPVELHGADVYVAHLSIPQQKAIAAYKVAFDEYMSERIIFTHEALRLVGEVFARPCPFEVWKPVAKAMREDFDEYGYKCFVSAYKELHGALPTKSGNNKKPGQKGGSPKKASAGLASRVADLKTWLASTAKLDINAGTLAAVTKAIVALDAVSQRFARVVNE